MFFFAIRSLAIVSRIGPLRIRLRLREHYKYDYPLIKFAWDRYWSMPFP